MKTFKKGVLLSCFETIPSFDNPTNVNGLRHLKEGSLMMSLDDDLLCRDIYGACFTYIRVLTHLGVRFVANHHVYEVLW